MKVSERLPMKSESSTLANSMRFSRWNHARHLPRMPLFEGHDVLAQHLKVSAKLRSLSFASGILVALFGLGSCSPLVSIPDLPQVVSVYAKPEHALEVAFGAAPIGFVPSSKELETVPCSGPSQISANLVFVKTSSGAVGWVNRDHL